MPWFFDRDHYQRIANLLKAGDIEAKPFANPATQGVKVHLEDGSIITWTNSEHQRWAFVLADKDGNFRGTHQTETTYDVPPETVARLIANFSYDEHVNDKSLLQEKLDRTEPIATVEVPGAEGG
jgi:hypothetical protein